MRDFLFVFIISPKASAGKTYIHVQMPFRKALLRETLELNSYQILGKHAREKKSNFLSK